MCLRFASRVLLASGRKCTSPRVGDRASRGFNFPMFQRLSVLFVLLIVLAGIIALVASVRMETFLVPGTQFRLPPEVIGGAGVAILAFGLVSVLLPARVGLAVSVLAWSLVAVGYFGQSAIERGERTLSLFGEVQFVHVAPGHYYEPWLASDSRYGTAGIPNAKRRYVNPDFDVVMHFDDEGWRVVQPRPPENPKGEIWFLGCSYTFGFGVDDNETFVALLAAEPWSRYRVRNFAHASWGTANAYLALREKLAAATLPTCVFYGWIGHHAVRNYRRNSPWRRGTKTTFPHFELENGALDFRGVVGPEVSNLPDGPDLDQKEFDLSVALIVEMDRLCEEKGVPFFLLAFEDRDAVARYVLSKGTPPCINVAAAIPLERLPHDGHPTAYWHRDVARLLAGNERIRDATRRWDLFQPGAVTPSPPHWTLANDSIGGFTASMMPASGLGNRFRVEDIQFPAPDRWKIHVCRMGFSMEEGGSYELCFRARADAPRSLSLTLARALPPRDGLGLARTLDVTTEWKEWRFSFVGGANEARASLHFWVSDSNVPIEIADVVLLAGGRDLLAAETSVPEPTGK